MTSALYFTLGFTTGVGFTIALSWWYTTRKLAAYKRRADAWERFTHSLDRLDLNTEPPATHLRVVR